MKGNRKTMDKETLDDIGALINTVDHYLEYRYMSIAAQRCIAQLVEGLGKIREELIRMIAEATLTGGDRPWCCHVNCREAATWEIVHGPSPDDNTQACDRHLAELCCDYNEVRRIVQGENNGTSR